MSRLIVLHENGRQIRLLGRTTGDGRVVTLGVRCASGGGDGGREGRIAFDVVWDVGRGARGGVWRSERALMMMWALIGLRSRDWRADRFDGDRRHPFLCFFVSECFQLGAVGLRHW